MATSTNSNSNYTSRDFFTEVIALAAEKGNSRVEGYARAAIAKLDERNSKRANSLSPTQKANEGIKTAILGILGDEPMTAAEISAALLPTCAEATTAKVSALCGQMVKSGQVTVCEVKIPKKGKVNGYTRAVSEDAPDEVEG